MKKIIALFVFSTFIATPAVQANDDDMIRISSAICDYIKNDDRTSIRKKLKAANLDLRQVYSGFVCQPTEDFKGGSLLRAASFYGSSEVSSFLIKAITSKHASFVEHDGKTIGEWLREAVELGSVKDVGKAKDILTEYEAKISG